MSLKCERSVLRQARKFLLSLVVVLAFAPSAGGAEAPLGLEEVKARLHGQHEKIESLHLRVRRVTTLSVAPKILSTWPSQPALPEYLGTDEVLVAFKGEKRYQRVLELDCRPTPLAGTSFGAVRRIGPPLDDTKSWTGEAVRNRCRDPQSAKFACRTTAGEKTRDCFPPPEYLMNVGMAVADPTASDEAHRNFQTMGLLPELLARWPYAASERTETIDGAECVVLEGRMQCPLSEGGVSKTRSVVDKLWLDLGHGLALRKRERRTDGQLVRVFNADLVEIAPGFWLPKRSRNETFPPGDAPKPYRDRPMIVRETELCLWVVNQVADGLFEIAADSPMECALGKAPAYHVRRVLYRWRDEDPSLDEIRGTTEEWGVRGVGNRCEHREGSKLTSASINTPRWSFRWFPAENRVVAAPVLPEALGWTFTNLCDREQFFRFFELRTGVFAHTKDRLDGREVDKIVVYLPPDEDGRHCQHGPFNPKRHLRFSGPRFPGRVFWFDLETGLPLKRQCRCLRPNTGTHDERIDYPAPGSLPGDLFTFEVPREAQLEVHDPALGRTVHSLGTKEEPGSLSDRASP